MFWEECWESSGKSLEKCLAWNFRSDLGKSWLMFGMQFRRVLESVLRNVWEESRRPFLTESCGQFCVKSWGESWKEPGHSLGKYLRNCFRRSLEKILLNRFG